MSVIYPFFRVNEDMFYILLTTFLISLICTYLQKQSHILKSSSPHRRVRRVITSDKITEIKELIKDGLSITKEDMSYEAIQNIIDVSRPYYALTNECEVKVDGKSIGFVAEVDQEMPFPYEGGQMGSSETVRHMAIAGSIAAALANPKKGKHYYLALNGFMRRNELLPKAIHDEVDKLIPYTPGKTRIFTYCNSSHKKDATSEIFLVPNGKDRNATRLQVTYKVLPQALFSRFFPPVEGIDPSMLGPWNPTKHKNPYMDSVDMAISDTKILDSGTIIYNTKIPRVCPSMCFGHFDTSPCLPVAFLIGHLVDAGMQSIALLWKGNGIKQSPLIATCGSLDATSLVLAGTHGLLVNGQTTRISEGLYEFTFDAYADNGDAKSIEKGDKVANLKFMFTEESQSQALASSVEALTAHA